MPFKYVGRKHSFVGHSLWQIVTQLPNYGKGRLIFKKAYMRYDEPSFMRILEAKPTMDKKSNLKGTLMADTWFRGKYMGPIDMSKPAYKTDFRLVPKHMESMWMEAVENYVEPKKKVLPSTIHLPPLLRLHLEQQEGVSTSRIPLRAKLVNNLHTILESDTEKPNVSTNEVDGIGTTDFPYLYEGIDLTQATYPPDPNSYRGPPVQRPTNPRDRPTAKCPVYIKMMEEMELEDEVIPLNEAE